MHAIQKQWAKAISEHVNYVIGMSREISDKAAMKFSVSFYSSLAFGKSVEDSFQLAKVDLKFESIPEDATPKLLVNNNVQRVPENPSKSPKPNSLLKAIEYFFKGTSILQERVNLNYDNQSNLDEPSQSSVPITSKEDLLNGELNYQEWINLESKINHLMSMMDIQIKNYYLAKEQKAAWGNAMVPPIIANTLEEAINSISDTTYGLKEALS
ncbi:MAG: hypothetical protein P0116_16455, partial [Candidatus Nitrosocosmicus sp.]|nr:hypothetical protein [Candidatus Nitrosocosmicus sp.]